LLSQSLQQTLKEKQKKEKEKYENAKAAAGSDEEEDVDEKPAKRQKKDPNKPKGALSAYMFFNKDIRQQVIEDDPNASFGEIGKIIGQKWKELTAQEKKKYEKLALEDRERYKKQLSVYESGGKPAAKVQPDEEEEEDAEDEDENQEDDDDDE